MFDKGSDLLHNKCEPLKKGTDRIRAIRPSRYYDSIVFKRRLLERYQAQPPLPPFQKLAHRPLLVVLLSVFR